MGPGAFASDWEQEVAQTNIEAAAEPNTMGWVLADRDLCYAQSAVGQQTQLYQQGQECQEELVLAAVGAVAKCCLRVDHTNLAFAVVVAAAAAIRHLGAVERYHTTRDLLSDWEEEGVDSLPFDSVAYTEVAAAAAAADGGSSLSFPADSSRTAVAAADYTVAACQEVALVPSAAACVVADQRHSAAYQDDSAVGNSGSAADNSGFAVGNFDSVDPSAVAWIPSDGEERIADYYLAEDTLDAGSAVCRVAAVNKNSLVASAEGGGHGLACCRPSEAAAADWDILASAVGC